MCPFDGSTGSCFRPLKLHNVSCGTPEAFDLVSHLGKEFRPVGISTRCLYLSAFTESAPIDWSKLRRPRNCRRMNAEMRGVNAIKIRDT